MIDDLEPGDAWKGEHLIKIPRVEKSPDGMCRECGNVLSKMNITGYCLEHRHLAGTMQQNGLKSWKKRRGPNKRSVE